MRSQYKFYGIEIVGAVKGDIIYFAEDEDNNGDIVSFLLPIPTDWAEQDAAGTPYVLGIAAGVPTWRRVNEDVVTNGWGVSWGTGWGF